MERLGRYEIIAHLANGGMGRVSLGRAIGPGGFERHVILKTLDLAETSDDEATAMFLDEARLLGMLHHQHVATIHEVATDEDDKLFLVLEYVHGHTAHDIWECALDHGVELPLDFTITVVIAAAAGLHYAHTRRAPDGKQLKIVHRDVTLSNLMIGYDGSVKVIDFGIAKAAVRGARTQAGYVKGKVGYMAPEQLRGMAVDARTDVFALGIVLYELTTMRRAFREPTDRATVERIKYGRIVKPSDAIPGYPRDLEEIVLKALQVDPLQRYQDAEALRRDLEALGHRYRLVLGDAAVSEVLNQLFPDQDEPWQRRATTRAEGEVEIAVDDDVTRPTTMPAVQPADDLVIALEESTTAPVPPTLSGVSASRPDGLEALRSLPPRPTPRSQTVMGAGVETIVVPTVPPPPPPPIAAPAATATPSVTDLSGEAVAIPLAVPRDDFNASKAMTMLRPPRKRRARAWIVVALAGAVLAGGAVGGAYVYQSSATASTRPLPPPPPAPAPKPKPAPVAAALPPPPPAPPPVAAPAPPSKTIKLAIDTTPEDATVLLDGQRLGHTPFRGTFDAAPGPHVLKIRRRGCVPMKLDVELTGDLKREIDLQPLADDAGADCEH
jgi:serine/threonine protein kinase